MSDKKFFRENRYVVVKRLDIQRYLTPAEHAMMEQFVNKIEVERARNGKRYNRFVCVADDWPEYEAVWKMIEQRVDSENTAINQ